MTMWNEEVALEVEALEATYGEELAKRDSSVSMLLKPAVDTFTDAYVQCQLELGIAETEYPEQSPDIQLQAVKGLGSSRLAALQAHLQHEAACMLGELVLGQLFESAKDWLTDNNHPEGSCIFCLEALQPSSSSSSSSGGGGREREQPDQADQQQQYMRLPCFHAFHQSCFISWWLWQQQSLRQQQQQLEQKTGATAAAALVQEQLPPKEGDCYQLSCPTCRAPFSLQQDLQHMQQQLIQQQQQQQQQQGGSAGSSSSGPEEQAAARLTPEQLEPYQEIQQRHAALYAAQQRREGIITEVNYSITDWDPSAVAAAEATTTTMTTMTTTTTTAAEVPQRGNSSRSIMLKPGGSSSRGSGFKCSATKVTKGAGSQQSTDSRGQGLAVLDALARAGGGSRAVGADRVETSACSSRAIRVGGDRYKQQQQHWKQRQQQHCESWQQQQQQQQQPGIGLSNSGRRDQCRVVGSSKQQHHSAEQQRTAAVQQQRQQQEQQGQQYAPSCTLSGVGKHDQKTVGDSTLQQQQQQQQRERPPGRGKGSFGGYQMPSRGRGHFEFRSGGPQRQPQQVESSQIV